MPVQALTFVLSDLETGRGLGHALIVPAARYASIAWRGGARLERRFVAPVGWKDFELDLSVGLPSGPLPARHAAVRVLLEPARQKRVIVQYVAVRSLDLEPASAALQLDAELVRLAG